MVKNIEYKFVYSKEVVYIGIKMCGLYVCRKIGNYNIN